MAYKTILAIWDGKEESRSAFEQAILQANQPDAHLNVHCIAADLTPLGFYAADMTQAALVQLTEVVLEAAQELAKEAEAMIGNRLKSFKVQHAAVRYHEVASYVGRVGRFHDLIVLPQPLGRDEGDIAEEILDGALFNTLSPVLVCPGGDAKPFGKRVVIAWNGDTEAMRAIRAAMPILRTAEHVELTMVNHRPSRADETTPEDMLVDMLKRQGVTVRVARISAKDHSVAEALRRHTSGVSGDLLVTGAYGHSRFRERLLGGVTRELLSACAVPVLMTH